MRRGPRRLHYEILDLIVAFDKTAIPGSTGALPTSWRFSAGAAASDEA
jgi:hypothetical protein